jgi:soluble lytic murein transglycosylase-like protein
MRMRFPSTPCLILLSLFQAFTSTAFADIYIDTGTEEEISLSNIADGEHFNILVADETPTKLAPETTSIATTQPVHMPYSDAVLTASRESSLDPALLHAVIAVESRHNPNAISPRGAMGLMQLMPITARRFNVSNPHDPSQNIRAGAAYLHELQQMFKGDLNLALAAYNAGPGAVLRYGSRIPPFIETERYVPKVLQLYRQFSSKPM